jgi:dihydroorotate dehydrogenase (fumarate)
MSTPDLSTTYLGLELPHPVVASASPLTGKLSTLRQIEDAGAAAVVLPSVFEEQLQQEKDFMDHYLTAKADSLSEAQSFFPDPDLYEYKSDAALERVQQAKQAMDIPVIASLNGATPGGWTEFATRLASAGADALELNLYEVAADPGVPGHEIERRQLETVEAVVQAVSIPVSVKIGPQYSAPAHMAAGFEEAGAAGLVLFNRFYQPDFDIGERTASRRLELSAPRDQLLALSWIAILRGQRSCSLGATSGVHGAEQVIKYLMAGADAVMTTSALLKNGPGHLTSLVQGLQTWMEEHGYDHLETLRGCMRREYVDNPELFERANYIKLLSGYTPGQQT